MNRNYLFSDKQFGFLGARSASLQSLTELDSSIKIIDNGGHYTYSQYGFYESL